MHGTQDMDTKAEDGLMASHFQGNEVIVPLPRTYVRQRTPADRDDPWPEKLQGWSHLQIINNKTRTSLQTLLIGLNCPIAVRPRDIVCGNRMKPMQCDHYWDGTLTVLLVTRAVNKYTVTIFRSYRVTRRTK